MRLRHVIAGLARLAKPMALDTEGVRAYALVLARKILAEAKKLEAEGETSFGAGDVLRDDYDLVDVRGHKHSVLVGVVAVDGVSPFQGFVLGGTYGRLTTTGGKAVLVRVNGQTPFAKLDLKTIEAGLYKTLSHEFVHAQEAFDSEGPDPRKDPSGYYNHPTEVNAWLRNVLDELEPKAREFASILRRTPGEAGVREFASKSGSWNQVSKHLSDENQVKFLSEIWQRFHVDAKSAPASELVDMLKKQYDVKAYASLRSQEGQLDLSMLSDPTKDEDNARAALGLVCKFADRHGLVVRASPGSEFAGSKEKAIRAYLDNGFVRNRGRNKDFTISDTMYRLPRGKKTAALQKFAEMTPHRVEIRFRELAAEIWGADTYETTLKDRIFMMTGDPGDGHLASVSSNGTQRARFGTLLRVAPKYAVRFSERFYDLPDDVAEGIIKHEVLHLGYPQHGSDFNKHAREIGAPLTENESLGGTVKVQVQDKPGARFRTVQEFPTEDEARAFVRGIRSDRNHEFFSKKLRYVL